MLISVSGSLISMAAGQGRGIAPGIKYTTMRTDMGSSYLLKAQVMKIITNAKAKPNPIMMP
jgi:hypothetical protein